MKSVFPGSVQLLLVLLHWILLTGGQRWVETEGGSAGRAAGVEAWLTTP